MLILLTSPHLTTHLWLPPPFCLPWVRFKSASSLLLWWTSSCDARLSKTGMSLRIAPLPPSFTSLYLSKLHHVMCSNQQFSHIHPSLSVSRPSLYSRFFVLFLPRLGRGVPNGKFRSGRQAAIKQLSTVNERSMYGKWHLYDRSAGNRYFNCYTWAVAGYWTFTGVVT